MLPIRIDSHFSRSTDIYIQIHGNANHCWDHSPSVFDNCCVNNKRLGRRITLIIFLVFAASIFAEWISQSKRTDCRCFKLIKFEQTINLCAQVLISFIGASIFQINDNDSWEFQKKAKNETLMHIVGMCFWKWNLNNSVH